MAASYPRIPYGWANFRAIRLENYFLDESIPNKSMPDELIDTNVRIDYGKLRHLLTVNLCALP